MSRPLLTLLLLALAPGCETKGGTTPGGGADSEGDTAACVPEVCNGVDDDCDGSVDEEPTDGSAVYLDGDGDGYGAGEATGVACEAAAGQSASDGDCDDADADVSPGAAEVCNNGKDDDCDGGANGCQLEGEVQASWAPFKILASEEDGLATDLQSGDIDGDGATDLFVVGYLGATETQGAYAFTGPIEEDRPTSEADAIFAVEAGTYLYDFDVLDDLDGDGVSEVALGVTSSYYAAPPYVYPPARLWTEIYRGGPGEHAYGGDVVLSTVEPMTGRFRSEDPSLLAACPDAFDVHGWCGYEDPLSSEAIEFAISGEPFWGDEQAGDLDGDGFDEFILEVTDGVDIVWGPLSDTQFGDANVSLHCPRNEGEIATLAEEGDTDGDGYGDLLVSGSVFQGSDTVYLLAGLSQSSPCSLDAASTTVYQDDPDQSFGGITSMAGDQDGDGAEDWLSQVNGTEGEPVGLLFLKLPTGAHDASTSATVAFVGVEPMTLYGNPLVPVATTMGVALDDDTHAVGLFSLLVGP